MSHENEHTVVVEFTPARLARQVVHGSGHMSAPDLIVRVLVLIVAAGVTVWTLTAGHTVLSLLGSIVFSGHLALTAVELYAAGAMCDLIERERER